MRFMSTKMLRDSSARCSGILPTFSQNFPSLRTIHQVPCVQLRHAMNMVACLRSNVRLSQAGTEISFVGFESETAIVLAGSDRPACIRVSVSDFCDAVGADRNRPQPNPAQPRTGPPRDPVDPRFRLEPGVHPRVLEPFI